MSIDIPISWLTYDERNPARGRWDQLQLERMILGLEGAPPGAYRFVDTPFDPDDGLGRVVVFPAGAYHDLGINHSALMWLMRDLAKLPWVVLIATSDECSTFDWYKIEPWPFHIQLWVMTPRPEALYPPGTRFIGEGSPVPKQKFYDSHLPKRSNDLFFSGQVGHVRREYAVAAMKEAEGRGVRSTIRTTPAFLTDQSGIQVSEPGGDMAYIYGLLGAWVAPAPAGACTQDSFRLYEALEAGCIPLADGRRADGHGLDYWRLLGFDKVAPIMDTWRDLPTVVDGLLRSPHENAALIGSRWQQYKRKLIAQLHADVEAKHGPRQHEAPWDDITVIIPTSPVPSNPSLDIIRECIASIRSELPGSEILVCADGVREEQRASRGAAYHEFLHELAMWCNVQHNVYLYAFNEHLHQSGMAHAVLDEIPTSHVLYVEGDTTLRGPIDFVSVIEEMKRGGINHMRFSHEARVLELHEYLFLESTPVDDNRFVRTIQYSNRPFVARADWFRETIRTYFAPDARTMLEDCLHGVWQHGYVKPYTDRYQLQALWEQHRGAVWAPGPNICHSGHLDGRGDDPKFPMRFSYPEGPVPDGAPQPGTR